MQTRRLYRIKSDQFKIKVIDFGHYYKIKQKQILCNKITS